MSVEPLWSVEAMAQAMRAERAGALPAGATGISIDSRSIAPGEAFFAIAGENRDGHAFVAGALAAGAGLAVVAADKRAALPAQAPAPGGARRARRALRPGAGGARAFAGASHRRHRLGRQDQHQGGAAPGARRRRRDPCLGRLLQQSLGRAAVARPLPADGALRGVRDRHEPCRRDRGADRAWRARMWRSSPRSSRCISNSSARSRRSPTPRPRFSLGWSRAEPPSSTATIRNSPACDDHARAAGVARIVSFGEHARADARLIKSALRPDCSTVQARILGTDVTYKLGAPGRHVVHNSLAVLAAVALAGADLALGGAGAGAAASRRPAAARASRSRPATARRCLIDESYNANPASMRAALALLGQAEIGAHGRRIAVLGDMLELGPHGAELHRALHRDGARPRRRSGVLLRPAHARLVGGASFRAPGGLCGDVRALGAASARRHPGRATPSW